MKIRKSQMIFAAALLIVLAGCGKKSDQGTEESAPSSAPAAPAAAVDMSTVGDVSGKITLDGAPPPQKPINMTAEPYCSKANSSPVMPQDVVAGDGGALGNVVVYIKEGVPNSTFTAPTDPVELDQKNCMYSPHVIALMAGQDVKVVNEDQTTHNIHPLPKDNREWNKSQPPGSPAITDNFARPEVAIPVKCNVHPWMKSYIAVFKHPYFAVTGKDGSFDIKNLPPGTYTIEAWQERYGTVDQQITVGAKESKSVNLSFKASAGG
jgi:plastocyanin